jgi:microcystin-dependent protein
VSTGYRLKDLTDLVDAVARELKIQDADLVERERIKEDLNDLWQDIAARKRWVWLQGHVDVQFKPYYGTGTVTVTPDSTTITFSVAPSVSLGSFAGKYFSVENFSEIYTIDTHTAGSTTAVLKSAYTGTLSSTATFKVWTDQVALPTDCRETVEVWHDFMASPMEALGHQELRKRQAEKPKAQGRPVYYNTYDFVDPTPSDDETESDRYRVLKVFPAIYEDSTTIHIDYVKEVSALVDDGDEPIMPMEDRMVLVFGARQLAWLRHRNPEASEMNRQRYEEKLARMMGKVEEGVDKPQLTPDSLYIARKRGPGLKRRIPASSGSGGSYTAPSYLAGATINGATITGNVTVNSGITIDGRDVSADGAALDAHLVDTSDAHDASAISVVATGNLAATDVQAALSELQTDVDSRALTTALTDHINDGTDAHAASAVTNTPSGNLAATTVQAALNELQTDVDSRATSTALTNHISDTTDAHAASAITNTPAGNLAATTVQAALDELQTDVDTRLTASSTNTLTNKTFDADGTGNSISNIENADIKAAAAIALNKLAATTASRALVSDGSGFVSASSVTATELGYVSGVTSSIQTQISAISFPAGVMAPYAGSSAPTGWLLCYGQAISRTTYADLFTAISTAYGVGDGSTTFNLPDLRGRTAVGKDDMGGAAASRMTSGGSGVDGATLGAAGGTQTHTLVTGEMPAHNHSGDGAGNNLVIYNRGSGGNYAGNAGGSAWDQMDTTPVTNTGGGGAHQNTQPSIILNYIIKT